MDVLVGYPENYKFCAKVIGELFHDSFSSEGGTTERISTI